MDDLTPYDPTRNGLPEKQISPVLSPRLRSLLEADTTDDLGVAVAIATDPDLRAETAAALPVLRAAVMQKAGRAGVRDVVGRRFAMFPQPDRSEGEWAAWWADYFAVLADVSWQALEAGMARYMREPGAEFMPKPGRLYELAVTSPVKANAIYNRARRAVEHQAPAVHDDQGATGAPKLRGIPSPQSQAEVKRMADEFISRQRPHDAAPQVVLPSIAGKPDEGGLTPEMRDLMSRRGEA